MSSTSKSSKKKRGGGGSQKKKSTKEKTKSRKRSASSENYVWQFKDNNGFANMDKKSSDTLEKALQSGTNVVQLSIGRWTYDFDVKKQQQKNTTTGVVRPLRRVSESSSKAKRASARQNRPSHHHNRGGGGTGGRGGHRNNHHINFGFGFGRHETRDENTEVIRVSSEDKEDEGERDGIFKYLELTEELLKGEEQCRLCLCDFEKGDKIGKLSQCSSGHYFHDDCGLGKTIVDFIHEKKKCPICSKFYGILTGNQPGGRMVIRKFKSSVPGFDDTDSTIEIHFYMDGGVQDDSHPSPGTPYHSESRVAYLPDNKKGNEVLEYFKKGWKRRLLFTVGYSETRQADHVIIYNGIHMKTSPAGGSHGYPDDTYLARVTDEFSAKGIV